MENIIWKTIEDHNGYEISNNSQIRNKTTSQILKISDSNVISLYSENKQSTLSVAKLMRKYHPNINTQNRIWKTIEGYNGYEISNFSEIRNKQTLRILKITISTNMITLQLDGKPSSHSVTKLMKKHHHLDVDELECWKDIINYENLYQISNLGRVKNKVTLNILAGSNKGYISVALSNNKTSNKYLVHRLVAIAFIPNPENKPLVNHIDGNKSNNNLDNLEWSTYSENTQHAINNNLIKFYKRPIIQLDLNNNIINTFQSIKEAAEITKGHTKDICTALKNDCAYRGYKWKYVERERLGRTFDMKDIDNEEWKRFEESNYEVSTQGRIRHILTKFMLTIQITIYGRQSVKLHINNSEKNYFIHRLVALTFLPNFKNLPEVDHKDQNLLNNKIFNLRWISSRENIKHSRAKSVDQFDLDGNFIKTWDCMKDVTRELNINVGCISGCCRLKVKSTGGFKWKYHN